MPKQGAKNLYLRSQDRQLLRRLADERHQGNESAAVAAAIRSYAAADSVARKAMIESVVVALGQAIEPDERYDPADDPRIKEPVILLAALIDDDAAEALATALRVLWARWAAMPSAKESL